MNSSRSDTLGAVSEPAPSSKGLGEKGEYLAEQYLKDRGFRIRTRRFRARCGEIDLVAEEGAELVFVEVKTRSSHRCGHPLESVTPRKRQRLLRAAALYLQTKGDGDRPCRFDVVAITVTRDGTARVEHLRDVIQASDRSFGG